MTENEELVAAPMVPKRNPKNAKRMITIPTIVKIAPTRSTVTAPQPNGSDDGARETARAPYGEGRAMGRRVLERPERPFADESTVPGRINVSGTFPGGVPLG